MPPHEFTFLLHRALRLADLAPIPKREPLDDNIDLVNKPTFSIGYAADSGANVSFSRTYIAPRIDVELPSELTMSAEEVFRPYHQCLWAGSVPPQRDMARDGRLVEVVGGSEKSRGAGIGGVGVHEKLLPVTISSWHGMAGSMVAQIAPRAAPSSPSSPSSSSANVQHDNPPPPYFDVKFIGLRE